MFPPKKPKKQVLAIKKKDQASGLFPSRKPSIAPPQMASNPLLTRNALRSQKGVAK